MIGLVCKGSKLAEVIIDLIVPNLLVEGVAEAIARASGEKIVIMNLMTQPGETDGFTAHDHLRVLSEYVDLSRFNAVVVNTGRVGINRVC